MRWKDYEGKKVFIILKNNREYSGVVISVDDSLNPLIWISIKDKFGNDVTFSIEEIKVIQGESS